jgi:hypothetical protein
MSHGDTRIAQTIDVLANDEARKAAWQFFITFSRFEYALKRAAFVCATTTQCEDAKPNWDHFATDYNEAFAADSTRALRRAIDYFNEFPPRKQIVTDKKLDWKKDATPVAPRNHLSWLLCMVRRVRNNLFHGGKFPEVPEDDPSRNKTLMEHAQSILEAVLEYDPKVRECFCDVVRQ